MKDQIEIILDNLDMILSVYRESDNNTARTYETLNADAGLKAQGFTIGLNQFKAYWKAIVATKNRLDKHIPPVPQNTDDRESEIEVLKAENERMKQELKEARPKLKNPKIGKWNITLSHGYYRACRRQEGKMLCVHLGTEFDPVKAAERIAAKERTLRKPEQTDITELVDMNTAA